MREDFRSFVPLWWDEMLSKCTSILSFVAKVTILLQEEQKWCIENCSIVNAKKYAEKYKTRCLGGTTMLNTTAVEENEAT